MDDKELDEKIFAAISEIKRLYNLSYCGDKDYFLYMKKHELAYLSCLKYSLPPTQENIKIVMGNDYIKYLNIKNVYKNK